MSIQYHAQGYLSGAPDISGTQTHSCQFAGPTLLTTKPPAVCVVLKREHNVSEEEAQIRACSFDKRIKLFPKKKLN